MPTGTWYTLTLRDFDQVAVTRWLNEIGAVSMYVVHAPRRWVVFAFVPVADDCVIVN